MGVVVHLLVVVVVAVAHSQHRHRSHWRQESQEVVERGIENSHRADLALHSLAVSIQSIEVGTLAYPEVVGGRRLLEEEHKTLEQVLGQMLEQQELQRIALSHH